MKNIIRYILMTICLAVFVWSGWRLYSIWNEGHVIDKEVAEYTRDTKTEAEDGREVLAPDWEALKAKNPDIVAWIYVPGAGISFPVVQGQDNSWYLNHTFNGEVNKRGSVFLDAGVSADFTADNSIIYGHSVDVGGIFTNLDKFADRSFFDAHPYFYVLTPRQNYKCPVFAFAKTAEGSAWYHSGFGDYAEETIELMENSALYQNDVKVRGMPLVTLSTCDLDYGFDSINRLVLTGVLEKTDAPIYVEEEK